MRKGLILAGTAIAIMTSCAVGPDFETPMVDGSADYQYDTAQVDSMETVEWWELFNNPTIDTLVKQALENNKDIGMSLARLDQAAAAHGFTRADLFPQISIGTGISRGAPLGEGSLGNNAYLAPQLNYELDLWGKLRRGKESSEAALIASDYGYRAIQIQIITSVIEAYLQYLGANTKLFVAQHTLESRQKSLDIMTARYDHGTIPLIDLNQSQIEYEVAVSAIEAYKRLIKLQMDKLNILLGEMPSLLTIEAPGRVLESLVPPKVPQNINSEILTRRPDLMQGQYMLKSQNAKVGVAVASRFPSLSLTGMLGLASNDLSNFVSSGPAWSIGADLLGPLFQLNKTKYRVEIEKAKTEELLNKYEKSVITAFSEVEYLLTAIETYSVQDGSAERKLGYATSAEKLSAARYDKGVTSYLEVLEAQRTLFQVGLDYADIRVNYLNSFVQLYAALGGGWISKEEQAAVEKAEAEKATQAKESGKEVEEPSDKDLAKEFLNESKERSKAKKESEKAESAQAEPTAEIKSESVTAKNESVESKSAEPAAETVKAEPAAEVTTSSTSEESVETASN